MVYRPQCQWRSRSRGGFSLVELLVVVAIIAVLVGLMLPAIQSVREAARLSQCKNNLRQVAMGCLSHLQSHGYYPWVGFRGTWQTPGRAYSRLGFGTSQTGGWLFSILPYIEKQGLFELDAGQVGLAEANQVKKRIETVVPTYVCASRGSPVVPGTTWQVFFTAPFVSAGPIVRSDYAGSVGHHPHNGGHEPNRRSGIFYRGMYDTLIVERDVTDGMSNVFLCGERYLAPEDYQRSFLANNHGWTVGYDQDSLSRGGPTGNSIDPSLESPTVWQPRPDTNGVRSEQVGTGIFINQGAGIAFGSPHSSFGMAMCDGRVFNVGFDVDLQIFGGLSGKADQFVSPTGGAAVPGSVEDLD